MSKKNKIVIHYQKEYLEDSNQKLWLESFERILKLSIIQVKDVDAITEVQLGEYILSEDKNFNTCYIPIIFSEENQPDDLFVEKNLENQNVADLEIIPFIDDKIEKSGWSILDKCDTYYRFNTDLFKYGSKALKNEEIIDESVWLHIIDLVYELKNRNNIQVNKARKAVYLSHVGSELHIEREKIRRELKHSGFEVYPQKKMNTNDTQTKTELIDDLRQVNIVIQLIGNFYQPIMDDVKISYSEYINSLYLDYIKSENNNKVKRLVWMSPYLNPKGDKQKRFIERFIHDIESNVNTEIIKCPLEVFKTIVVNRIKELSQQIEVTDAKASHESLYLIHASERQADIQLLKTECEKVGLNVFDSLSDKLEIQIEKHKEYLLTCDNILIYYDFENDIWLRSKVLDIIKSVGFNKTSSFRNISIICEESKSSTLLQKYSNIDFHFYKKGLDSNTVQSVIKKIQS